MKIPSIVTISLFLLTGASFAGPLLSKAPPVQPILPPVTPAGGWYTGVSGGYLWLNDASTCGCIDLNFNDGWGVNAAVGYHFSNGISLGLSSGYLSGDFDLVQRGSGNVSGSADLQMVPITLNGSYSLNLTDSFSVYVGGGLGTAWSRLNGVGGNGNNNDWHFAWQGRAGVGYKVNDGLRLNLGYRYIQVADAFGDFGDARGHMAEAGFKVNF